MTSADLPLPQLHENDPRDRLTRVEILLGQVIKNQEDGRDRSHNFANNMQIQASRLDRIEAKLEPITDIKEAVDGQAVRLAALELIKEKVLTGWQIIKLMLWIVGGFFSVSLMLGEKIARLPVWSAFK